MATFASILADCLVETKRPDQVVFITRKIKETIQALHMVDYFNRDIVENAVTFGEVLGSLRAELPPRFRKLVYARPWPIGEELPSTNFYKVINPGEIYDAVQQLKMNCIYQAGNYMHLYIGSGDATRALAAYYSFPLLASEVEIDADWIVKTDAYAPAIVLQASAKTLARLGSREEASGLQSESQIYVERLMQNEIYPFGIPTEYRS